ncbi:hypothetical protein [Reyranella soli]|uniref:Uncharacterized protein n=1 Tax=Reyranella soli TaxID=1230389 RepID=A0A512NKP1_9HYPH|nr:hypothetical protein [Reyranella soli]GEP59505.1 hypothetical protein RSO01_66710 [Reyranella soli]
MVDSSKPIEPEKPAPTSLSAPDFELEKARLEAELQKEKIRADVRKVVYGTMIVGVAVAAFPFFQEVARSAFSERIEAIKVQAQERTLDIKAKSEQKVLETKNQYENQIAEKTHQLEQRKLSTTDVGNRRDYLEKLASEGRNERIEKRIIIAEFFSFLAETGDRDQWVRFRDYLLLKQTRINEEKVTVAATAASDHSSDEARSAAIERLAQISAIQDPATDSEIPGVSQIKEVQRALGIADDGRFSAMTRTAIREFQTGMFRRNPSEWPQSDITGTLASRSGRVLRTLKPMPAVFMSPFERAYLGSDSGMFTSDPLSGIDQRQLASVLSFLGVAPQKIVAAASLDDRITLLRERIAELRTTLNLPAPKPILDSALYEAVWKTSPLNVNARD